MIYDLQKASLWKRISAFLFDFILLGIVSVLCAWLLSLALGYDGCRADLDARYAAIGSQYDIDLQMSQEEFSALDEAGRARMEAAYAALSADEAAVRAYNLVMQLSILIVTFGVLTAYLILEFAVPLKFKNGVTLGKKIFGLAVMRTDGVRLSAVALFIRTVLGKFAIETMIPLILISMIIWGSIGIVGPAVLLGLLALEIGVMAGTRTHSLIHDLMAGTVVIDLPSQMIFDTPEAMMAYKEQLEAQSAVHDPY